MFLISIGVRVESLQHGLLTCAHLRAFAQLFHLHTRSSTDSDIISQSIEWTSVGRDRVCNVCTSLRANTRHSSVSSCAPPYHTWPPPICTGRRASALCVRATPYSRGRRLGMAPCTASVHTHTLCGNGQRTALTHNCGGVVRKIRAQAAPIK